MKIKMSKEEWGEVYEMLTCNECKTPPHFVGIKYRLLDKLEEKLDLSDYIRDEDLGHVEYPARVTYISKNDKGEEFFREMVINSVDELFYMIPDIEGEKFVKWVGLSMNDREKIIPHQLYSEQAIDKLQIFSNDFMIIRPDERTLFGNIPTKKEHVLETLLLIPYRQFDKEIDKLVKLIEDAKADAFIVEKELGRYKEKYGELPVENS